MEKTIRICDRCGNELNDDIKNYIYSYRHQFELCNKCYEIMKPLKEKHDKDYETLVKKVNKIEADFNSEFKAFLGEDK